MAECFRRLPAKQKMQVKFLPASPNTMNPQEFIVYKLQKLRAAANPAVNFAYEKDLGDFIYQAIMSKKFRKYSVNPEYQEHIRSAIALNIQKQESIKFTLVFGGYKLWRFAESPEADWAELFSMIYYANWVKDIAANYKPGVWFDFYSDDVIVESIDNIPTKDTESYRKSFKDLLDFLKQYLPENLLITYSRVGDQYASLEDFKQELKEKLEQTHINELTPKQLATLQLNVKPKAGETPDWKEIQRLHDAYTQVSKRRPYYRTPDKIMAITKKMANAIAVGTTKTSVAKFWAGVGALKKADGGYMEYVLSPSQLENSKYSWADVSIDGLNGKNFNRVRVLE